MGSVLLSVLLADRTFVRGARRPEKGRFNPFRTALGTLLAGDTFFFGSTVAFAGKGLLVIPSFLVKRFFFLWRQALSPFLFPPGVSLDEPPFFN